LSAQIGWYLRFGELHFHFTRQNFVWKLIVLRASRTAARAKPKTGPDAQQFKGVSDLSDEHRARVHNDVNATG
jgi:hypothetical protein